MKIKIMFILGALICTSSAVLASSAPIITTQPKSQTVNEGSSVTFSVVAEGGGDVYPEGENFTTPISDSVNLNMIWIEPGTFIMGSPTSEIGREHELIDEAQHQVTLTKGYWLGKYEVTQAQYKAIMGTNPASDYGVGDNYPVYCMTKYDATNFCAKLTQIERAAGRLPAGYEYTLPTEAQWEYACRAGTTTALNNGKNLTSSFGACPNLEEVAWYKDNGDDKAHPVGQKKPNAWGLYDMHGNVWEICLDYPTNIAPDVLGTLVRGGASDYQCEPYFCRSAYRHYALHFDGDLDFRNWGFRVALVPVQAQASAAADTLTYQWYKDGKAISGATGSSYTISSAKTSDAGSYTVTVSNSAGSVTSSAATLTVKASAVMPKIITQPKSQTVNEGSSVTFSVVAESGGEEYQEGENFTTPISGNVNLDMIWIEPGTFIMGSPESEEGRGWDETQHQVTLTQGFWMGKYEITQAQYQAIMGENPSRFIGDNLPLESVNWVHSMDFCAKLTEIERKAGRLPAGYEYALPTEAQWEYACRAGTTGAYNVNGASLSDLAWYEENSNDTTHPVGQKKPNAWGLYDMHGNVHEWCMDYVGGDYSSESVTDPTGVSSGENRIFRGGAYKNIMGEMNECRSANRCEWPWGASDNVDGSGSGYDGHGFRVALVPVQAQASVVADTLTYQWYKDGVAISGATGSSYTINSVKASDAGKYTVKVCNSAGCVTSEIATLTVNVKPTITTQPKSQTVNEGSSATFSVTATGTAPLSYQWKKNGSNISGATSSTYRISSAKTSDAGSYTVTVSNSAGSVTSSAATLTVNVPVTLSSITINGNSSVNVGSTATYTCTATYSNGTTKTVTPTWSISSGTSYASITSGGVLTGKAAGTATVKATYEGKTATKNVTVNAVKPTITTQPKSQTVNEGNSVTFSVVATGTAPLSYQWYKDGKAISGATGSSYTISSAKSSDAGSYYVIVSNTAGSVTSNTVTLTVILKPVITSQPRSLVVDEDDPATFSVVATGTAPLSYQWYKDGRAISGATGSSYTISSAKKSDEGSYYVIVRNNAGSVTSNTVTLTVNKLEPDGTAIRSISINGLTATVTLTVVPNKAVNVYFVEENIPAIGTIIPNDGGVYTPAKNVIRWSFLDNASRVVSYTVTVPNYLDKVVYVNGTVTFDTNVRAITGDNELDFTLKTHPADTNENFEITTPEVSLYAVAWKLGQNWSREPADIPMSYVSRAALIWVNGGDYIYDASKAKPACWVNITARAASEDEPSVSTTERTVSMDEGKANVSIDIVPAEGISVYLVEEQLSADVTLNVTDISDGGNYIPEKNVIRWSFLDGSPRTLTYTLEPEEGFVGKVTLNGEVMFDEETFTIEGDTEANFGDAPIINYVVDGKTLILNFTGTLYESEDTVTWTEVEGAESPFIVDTTKGKKFYRCVK